MAQAHKVTKRLWEDGTWDGETYEYRGIRVERHDRERGYSGHWRAKIVSAKKYFNGMTRAEVLTQIDSYLNAQGA